MEAREPLPTDTAHRRSRPPTAPTTPDAGKAMDRRRDDEGGGFGEETLADVLGAGRAGNGAGGSVIPFQVHDQV